MEIVIATLVVGVIGFTLVFAGQEFHVEVDECTGCGACAQKCPAKVISGGNVKIEVAS